MDKQSDGSSATYYELPKGATELQHLISAKNMNAQLGEIFRACYRYGEVEHSPQLRDIKKIIFYAQAELERLEAEGKAAMELIGTATTPAPTRPTAESTCEDLKTVLDALCDLPVARCSTTVSPRTERSFSDVFYQARMCDKEAK